MGVSTVHAIEVQQYGGPETLVYVERPEPADIEGRVRIAVAARVVGPADILTREGVFAAFTPGLKPPFVLGWDFAGTVVSDAGGFTAGQRVVGHLPWFALGGSEGTYVDTLLADPSWLAPIPDSLTFPDAATLGLNGLTAAHALRLVDIKPGETLLVSGASGAVGGFAVQLAAAEGAHVIGIAAPGDEDYVTSLGAKDVITRVDDLVGAVRTLVPQGVAAALDAATVGPSLLSAVRDRGTFIAVTDPATPVAERGIRVGKVSVVPDSATLSELVRLLDAGDLTVRLADVLPLADAAEAHRRAAAGVRGKVVLSG